jgi:hypothetical protein
MDSIRKEVDKELKEKNPFLFPSKKEKFGLFINNHSKWYFVVFGVLFVFFCLQFINIPFLNFIQIDDDAVKTLIDSRTTNIVTLIGVTFAIIGFLIANLAIKESFTYNLLFKKSTFFPVAFIALTLIASFIVLSTLKVTLSINYQRRTLLVGTYLILIITFLIGYLFVQLVCFTNQKHLLDLVMKELISESKKNLLIIGRRILSINKIAEFGFYQYSMAFFKQMTKGDFVVLPDHGIISDIKIEKLKKKSEALKEKDKIFAKEIFLYRKLANQEDGFFFVDENDYPELKQDIKMLNKCIVTSKNIKISHTEAKEYVLQKLQENIKSNDDKTVEIYLNMLAEIYKLQSEIYKLQQEFKL